MHMSANFLQELTDIDVAFAYTVIPCLNMARHIRYLVDTFEDGDPDGIAEIKQSHNYQLERLRCLQDRWEDVLKTARGYDESVTFRRLSEIVETPEDIVDEAWSHAKEFIDSYETDAQHRSHNTTPVTPYTSSPLRTAEAIRKEGPDAAVAITDTCTTRQAPPGCHGQDN